MNDFVSILQSRARVQPERHAYTFLLDGEEQSVSFTYAELDRAAKAIAAHLLTVCKPGEPALLLYPAGLEYIAAFFGCLYAGVIAVPAYPPRRNPEAKGKDLRLAAVLEDARPATAMTTGALTPLIQAALAASGRGMDMKLIVTDNIDSTAGDDFEPAAVRSDGLAFLQYTSGSTSDPKGVMVSHGNLIHNANLIATACGHDERSTFAGWLPIYHDMGLIGNVLQPMFVGSHSVLMSPMSFLQRPSRWLQAITRYQAFTSGGPNFAYELCVRKISPEVRGGLNLESWKVAFNGAEPVRQETLDSFVEAFGPYGFKRTAFYPCYGLAEATLMVSGGGCETAPKLIPVQSRGLGQGRLVPASPDATDTRCLVGCGTTLQDQQIAIVNPNTGIACDIGEVGEIWVSGGSVALGYWKRGAESEATFQARAARFGDRRFLRTGDLGCLVDGELVVTGRLKDMMIVRGRNHYPQDLELTAERAAPGLRAGCGAAFAVPVEGTERLIIVQEVERTAIDQASGLIGAIRRSVMEAHDVQPRAVVLVRPGAVPKTSSGKLQRHACKLLFLNGELTPIATDILQEKDVEAEPLNAGDFLTAPRERREELLCQYLISQASRVTGVSLQAWSAGTSLVRSGLDSLSAAELDSRIRSDLGISAGISKLLDDCTLREVARDLLARLDDPEVSGPITVELEVKTDRSVTGGFALSSEQQRFWFLDRLSGDRSACSLLATVRLTGTVNPDVLARSIREMAQSQASLRTYFVESGGRIEQMVAPAIDPAIVVHDLRHLQEPERENQIRTTIAEHASRRFHLDTPPLLRAELVRLGEEETLLVLAFHHIIADALSVKLFVRDLAQAYEAVGKGHTWERPVFAYTDFTSWQKEFLESEAVQPALAYWQRQLQGAPRLCSFPTDRPRSPLPSYRTAAASLVLPAEAFAELRQPSQSEGVTPFMLLLASFQALLYRCSGQGDLLVGSPVSGRIQERLQDVIGTFATPMPLRTQVRGDLTFRELLQRVRRVALDAYAHQTVPLAKVVKAAGLQNGRGLFQVMFTFVDDPMAEIQTPQLRFHQPVMERSTADLDLSLNIFRSAGGLQVHCEYNVDLFEAATIEHLMKAYVATLEQLVHSPATRLCDFHLDAALEARTQAIREQEENATVAIAASFTAEPVEEALSFWLEELGIARQIRFAPYNQIFQQLLDPESLLAQNRRGLNVLLLRAKDVTAGTGGADLVSAVRTAAGHSAVPHLIGFCPSGATGGVSRVPGERDLQEALARIRGVTVFSSQEVLETYPVSRYYDRHSEELGGIPYTAEFYAALGTMLARKLEGIRRAPYKVIVADCDQTLWKGVCGEEGAWGVEIDEPRRRLQEFLVKQREQGKLLCLCSRNNESDVREVFEQRQMPLRWEHLAGWRINWGRKSENLRSLAGELGLGLESFVFLDDDAVECAEVQAGCREVLTMAVPGGGEGIERLLRHGWAFDQVGVSREDRERAQRYQEERRRGEYREQCTTLEEFLGGLGLEVGMAGMQAEEVERVAELSQRTNQFHCAPQRYTAGGLETYLGEGGWQCQVTRVRDRFGDYGVTGAVVYRRVVDVLEVGMFLLSCRALGRGVEHRMLAEMGRQAAEVGAREVEVHYQESGKNRPAREFLEATGGKRVEGGYRYAAEGAAEVRYRPGSGKASSGGQAKSVVEGVRSGVDSALAARILNGLSEPAQLLRMLRSRTRPRPRVDTAYVEPVTDIERKLAAIWAELLTIDRVGIHDDFFKLGGDSMLATQVLSRIQDVFGIEIPIMTLFVDEFTVGSIAKTIATNPALSQPVFASGSQSVGAGVLQA